MLVTADEETGSAASRAIIEAEALASEAVLVLEPALPGGALKTSRKGCGEFVLRVSGLAAHAGIEPERGASAISELARQIPRIEALQDAAAGTTINVGVIRGGTRPNVVAAERGGRHRRPRGVRGRGGPDRRGLSNLDAGGPADAT